MKVSTIIQALFPSQRSRDWTHDQLKGFSSKRLGINFDIDVYLPPAYDKSTKPLRILFLNDGQDAEALQLMTRLKASYQKSRLQPFLLVAIPAMDRMQTYGVGKQADYKGRGSKARPYSIFITKELLPELRKRYRVSDAPQAHSFAGFSLGALSALDIVWNHPDLFGQVGVFSGSLWWRSEEFDPKFPDANRIMHTQIKKGPMKPGLRFWFQTGTLDETEDRNNNGVIDSIDDTQDLMAILRQLGYRDLEYVEVEGGEHNPQTWGRVLPQFLRWGFSR
ncbi:MAG: esterase family protein [Saprospiraceae bacterium]|nr:esterase family protein [Saprospiraceae bacterium]